MTQLRQMMLEELQRRNYSQRTVCSYIRAMRDFAKQGTEHSTSNGLVHGFWVIT